MRNFLHRFRRLHNMRNSGVRIEVADIGLVDLLPELDFGKAEGIVHAGNFCDDRIIRGGVRKLYGEDPLCGLLDCCLNEICCHIVSYPIASRSLKMAETRSKSIDLRAGNPIRGGLSGANRRFAIVSNPAHVLKNPLCIWCRYGILSRYL